MSSIRKLSIKGIRNFDDDGEVPTIKFSRPLTLILGPNGTGKTTIIECLKYALSGEFPPDSDRGKAFVHDPSLKKMTSVRVRGNVKCEIKDCRGDIMTISRSVEAVRLENNLKFKTLDSTLTRVNRKTGEEFSVTSRCADVDVEIMASMGVSKSILNYVLFCHQDDANWPFESGQKLKERFDEIFDTTRYNKALDAIRKIIKEKQDDLRGLVGEQRALNIVVDEVKSKDKTLNNYRERRKNLQTKIRDYTNALKPINERLAEIKEIEAEYCKWQLEYEKKKLEHKLATQQIISLKENIKELYSGSTAELSTEIESYEEILRDKNTEIVDLERELRETNEKEAKVSNLIAEKRVTVGTLRQQMCDQTLRIEKRNDTLRDMLAAWNMNETIESSIQEKDALRLMKKVEDRLRQSEQEMETERQKQEREQEQFERKVNVLRAERSTIESQLAHNESELIKIKSDIRTNTALLRQSGAMEKKLNDVENNLAMANKKFEELTRTLEIDSLKRQIQEANACEETNEVKYNRAEKEVASLREQSALQIKLESNMGKLMDTEKELQLLREKHGEKLKILFGKTEFSETNMAKTMNDVQTILNKRVQDIRNEIEKVQYEEMKLKTSVEHKKQELEKRMKEIRNDKERLSLHCKDCADYREVLLSHSKKLKDLEDKRGMYAYQGAAYNEYVKQLNQPDACCPLCHRGFENSREATKLATEMKTEMTGHPDRLKNCEKELAMQRKKYDSLLQLQPVVEKIENFETVEKTKIEREVDSDMKHLSALTLKVKRLQESISTPEKKLSDCNDMIGDMALWDRYADEIETINDSIAEIQQLLRDAGVKSNKTLQEAETEQNNLQKMLKDTRREIKELQAELDSRSEQLRRAAENQTKLLEQQLQIHQEMQDIKQAKETLNGLISKEAAVAKNVCGFEERMAEIDDKLVTAIDDLDRVKQDIRGKQETGRKTLLERSKAFNQLNSIHAEVNEFYVRKIDDQLKSIEQQLQTVEKKALQLKSERISRESAIAKIKEDRISQDERKRNLTDNLSLRRKEIERDGVRDAWRKIKDKLEGSNLDTVSNERKELCETRDSTERERNIAQGNEQELGRNIEHLMQELQKPDYRKARANYKEKCVELTITRTTIDDLHKYSIVLDKSMIQYHEERMNTINQFMEKLWNLIYTGTDTTSIQIRAEATTTTANKKRQFNYKLVQVKHGVEMDMRGRCSAGQKVLASIILRLALAETFCAKCGVLALDEPTTNLDENNARSLADTLHKYVKLRKDQKNFQLIIITHDDNFVPELGQLRDRNSYYELFRHANGLSGIRRVACGVPLPVEPVADVAPKKELPNDEKQVKKIRTPPKRVRRPSPDVRECKREKHFFE